MLFGSVVCHLLNCGGADGGDRELVRHDPAADAGTDTSGPDSRPAGPTTMPSRDGSIDAAEGSVLGNGDGEGAGQPRLLCADPESPTTDAPACGNGFRDGAGEECDDGNSVNTDLCSDDCRVRDALVAPSRLAKATQARRLGAGRHAANSGCDGFAVAYVEGEDPVSVSLAVFDGHGAPKHTVSGLNASFTALTTADPVVAGLPEGRFVVAWNDFGGDGDQLGVALRLVDTGSAALGPALFANARRAFSQHRPDIVRTASEIVVAWQDDSDLDTAPDLRFRRFDASLTAQSPSDEVLAASDAAEGGVALASFRESWAAAWRAGTASDELIRVRAGQHEWQVNVTGPGPSDDKPALVELDEQHLLVAYSMRRPDGRRYGLAGAILSVSHPGTVASFSVAPLAVTDTGFSQTQPSIARGNGRVYLGWRSNSALGDLHAEELWLKELSWTLSGDALTLDLSRVEIPLPRDVAHQAGDQRNAALAWVPLWPAGALAAVWEDSGGVFGPDQGRPDVAVAFTPLPLLRTTESRSARE
jgi:cysteine-rich repeat protein